MEIIIVVLLTIVFWNFISLQRKMREVNSLMKHVDTLMNTIRELKEKALIREDALTTAQEENRDLSHENAVQEFALAALAHHLQKPPSAHTTVLHDLKPGTTIEIVDPPDVVIMFGSDDPALDDSWTLVGIIDGKESLPNGEVFEPGERIDVPNQHMLIWTSSPDIQVLMIPPTD